jgi:hypothetical protein
MGARGYFVSTVRVALQRERQFGRGAEPFAVNAPPVGTRDIVLLEKFIDPPPIISIVGRLVEKREPALPVERNLHPCVKWRSGILSRGVVSAIERDYDAQRQRSNAGHREAIGPGIRRRRIDLSDQLRIARLSSESLWRWIDDR